MNFEPVLIPGAFERREGQPRVRAADAVADPEPLRPPAGELHDRAQLELEREGGGAPRNRTPRRYPRLRAALHLWV
jgi:hypothetical protein